MTISVYDNIRYIVNAPVNQLFLSINFIEKGTEVVFLTGDNPTLLIDHINNTGNIYWANGILPSLEPNTLYELSVAHVYIESEEILVLNAVLTPFKLVES